MLTNYERETIISYNAGEDIAYVYSSYGPDIRRFDKLVEEREEAKFTHKDGAGKFYEIPKKWLKIRPNRILTAEEKEHLRERFSK